MTVPKPKHTANTIQARERALKALELRKAGLPFREIAPIAGYKDESGARKAVEKLLSTTTTESVDSFRAVQLERLDKMLVGVWSQAIKGNLGAIDRVLKIEERRAKLLGLDAATQVDVVDNRQLDLLVRELQSRGLSPADVFESLIAELAHANRADSRP